MKKFFISGIHAGFGAIDFYEIGGERFGLPLDEGAVEGEELLEWRDGLRAGGSMRGRVGEVVDAQELVGFTAMDETVKGAALVFPGPSRSRDPDWWWGTLRAHEVTLWNTTPMVFAMLWASPRASSVETSIPSLLSPAALSSLVPSRAATVGGKFERLRCLAKHRRRFRHAQA